MDQKHQPHPIKPAHHALAADPTKGSRSLAIALVCAAVFLLAAAGIVVWLIRHQPASKAAVQNVAASDVATVKKASFVSPATLPPNYVQTNQSTISQSRQYFDDTATNCGLANFVLAVPTDKAVKDAAVAAFTDSQTPGFIVTATVASDNLSLKDTDGKQSYAFSSLNLDQDVAVQGLDYTKQNNVLLYKQFGSQIAVLSYSCKSGTWASKKDELATLAKTFTVKTER